MTIHDDLQKIYGKPRLAYKKEQRRIIGTKTGIEALPFNPSNVPVICPSCGKRAFAEYEPIEKIFITYCFHACKPIKNQLIIVEAIEVKQS